MHHIDYTLLSDLKGKSILDTTFLDACRLSGLMWNGLSDCLAYADEHGIRLIDSDTEQTYDIADVRDTNAMRLHRFNNALDGDFKESFLRKCWRILEVKPVWESEEAIVALLAPMDKGDAKVIIKAYETLCQREQTKEDLHQQAVEHFGAENIAEMERLSDEERLQPDSEDDDMDVPF